MLSEYVLSFEVSDVIVTLIAGLSALYARWAAEEAKRANELSLLSHRKAIYDAFYELKMHMERRGMRPDLEQVSKFYYPSRDAAFYVKKSLSSEIEIYYGLCLKVADFSRLGNSICRNESDEIKKAFNDARKISEPIDRALQAAVKKYAANG